MVLPSSDTLRTPLLLVLANGAPLSGALRAHVLATGNRSCDTFDVTLSLSADPLHGAAFWANAAPVLLDVQASIGGGFTSLVQGYVDSVTLDPIEGLAHLSGRDLSAALIEARTRETFANRTASEIATLLAGRHGLAAQVQQTTTPVGRYWQLEHDRITLDQFSRATTEWDLLVGLAEHEGFDLWVARGTLYFQPPVTAASPQAVLRPVATPNGPANVESLRLERALTLAGDITVTVSSWNSRMAQGFSQSASTAQTAEGAAAARQYSFVLPNLTPDVALRVAQQRLAELSLHERVITADMPGDLLLDAHLPVALEGTGSAFDQSYRVDELVRHIDVRRGFHQVVRAHGASGAA